MSSSGWMDGCSENKRYLRVLHREQGSMRSDPIYLHRGFIGWSGIGRAPVAMYFIYIICIYKDNALLQLLYYLTAISSLRWDVYHIFPQLLNQYYQACMGLR